MADGRRWFAENLQFEHPKSMPAPAEVHHREPDYQATYDRKRYGRLYTFAGAVESAPSGWQLPTFHDWNDLLSKYGTLHDVTHMSNEPSEAIVMKLNDAGFGVIRGLAGANGQPVSQGEASRASFWCAGVNVLRILRNRVKTPVDAEIANAIHLTVAGPDGSRAYCWAEPASLMLSVRYVEL
jgi:uncharacterized protein (TIGR02145 family)